jgi:hypothetical protein
VERIKMTHSNRLVKVPDIGDLTTKIAETGWLGGLDELKLPRKQQDAERRRLPGAVSSPKVKWKDERLKLYWRGGDGQDYQATLVGLDYQKDYAIVTDVTSERKEDPERKENPYQIWHTENGPWF